MPSSELSTILKRLRLDGKKWSFPLKLDIEDVTCICQLAKAAPSLVVLGFPGANLDQLCVDLVVQFVSSSKYSSRLILLDLRGNIVNDATAHSLLNTINRHDTLEAVLVDSVLDRMCAKRLNTPHSRQGYLLLKEVISKSATTEAAQSTQASRHPNETVTPIGGLPLHELDVRMLVPSPPHLKTSPSKFTRTRIQSVNSLPLEDYHGKVQELVLPHHAQSPTRRLCLAQASEALQRTMQSPATDLLADPTSGVNQPHRPAPLSFFAPTPSVATVTVLEQNINLNVCLPPNVPAAVYAHGMRSLARVGLATRYANHALVNF